MSNPSAYTVVTQNITTFTKQNFHLGDYYLVIRNDSSSTGNGTRVESTYQFMGEEMLPLRQRTLTGNELTSLPYMTYVDEYFLE